MTLPQDARTDLLEYLGAAPVAARQVDHLICQAMQRTKRAAVEARARPAVPEHA